MEIPGLLGKQVLPHTPMPSLIMDMVTCNSPNLVFSAHVTASES